MEWEGRLDYSWYVLLSMYRVHIIEWRPDNKEVVVIARLHLGVSVYR